MVERPTRATVRRVGSPFLFSLSHSVASREELHIPPTKNRLREINLKVPSEAKSHRRVTIYNSKKTRRNKKKDDFGSRRVFIFLSKSAASTGSGAQVERPHNVPITRYLHVVASHTRNDRPSDLAARHPCHTYLRRLLGTLLAPLRPAHQPIGVFSGHDQHLRKTQLAGAAKNTERPVSKSIFPALSC